jgi:hypothetical protein
MIKSKLFLLIPLLMLLVMASCKFAPDAINMPNWQVNVLGPLINATASANQVVQLTTLKGSVFVSMKQLGIAVDTTHTIPATGYQNLPAYNFKLFNSFKSLILETGTLYFTIQNKMAVPLNISTRIRICNHTDTLHPLLDHTIAENVNAYSGSYPYTIGVDLSGKTLEDSLLMLISHVSTDTSNGPVYYTGDESFEVDAFVEGGTLYSGTIYNDSLEFRDTTAFSVQGYKVKTVLESGIITTFITNGLPFDVSVQFYFMAENKVTILDSLFDVGTTVNARMSAAQPSLDSVAFTITNDKINHLNEAKYICSDVRVRSTTTGLNAGITLAKTDSLNLLMVGNLMVKLN